jgi:hypothetical protein
MLADGTSDEPVATHVAALARKAGVELDVVVPNFARLNSPPGRTVRGRLDRLLEIDSNFDLIIVHRDAEAQEPSSRVLEIQTACGAAEVDWPQIPVVPVRMTEAWLLLDEASIRLVAGTPTGRAPLNLPDVDRLESVPDPKAMLQDVLQRACGLRGRRLREFKRDFPEQRRQLLERLDRGGPIRSLSAWQQLETATREAAELLVATRG